MIINIQKEEKKENRTDVSNTDPSTSHTHSFSGRMEKECFIRNKRRRGDVVIESKSTIHTMGCIVTCGSRIKPYKHEKENEKYHKQKKHMISPNDDDQIRRGEHTHYIM